MKYLRRYLSLLFALVMCVSLFSTTVLASMVDLEDSHIYIRSYVSINKVTNEITAYPNNDTVEGQNFVIPVSYNSKNIYPAIMIDNYIKRNDGKVLFQSGRKLKFWINNIRAKALISYGDSGEYSTGSLVSINIVHTDGTIRYLNSQEYKANNVDGISDFTMEFTPEKDIDSIQITCQINYINNNQYKYAHNNGDGHRIDLFLGELATDSFTVQYEQSSEEAGLLDGIKSGIGDLVNKIKDVFNAITELPQKLWDLISEGLKSLFVPSEEDMVAYKDKWDELLSQRFGAVYQVVNIMTESWDGIMQADETNTISFPKASLNFSGTEFEFGGYDVQIVPTGFDVLTTAIKSIVAIVCTVAFINGLRKRYDEIMGVET